LNKKTAVQSKGDDDYGKLYYQSPMMFLLVKMRRRRVCVFGRGTTTKLVGQR